VLAESDLIEIGQIGAYRRDPDAITIACLVGIGVQDVVAAETALAVMHQA
jgi:ornithine cyclodeaminase/alanine dehydrogenase-like protein (mu-crystallin family)